MQNMDKIVKLTLLPIALAAFSAVSSATAGTVYNGDLIIGFTVGTGNDLVYDLGPVSAVTNNRTWSLTSLLSGYDLATVNWGIIGNTLNGGTVSADNSVYTTSATTSLTPGPLNQSGYNAV